MPAYPQRAGSDEELDSDLAKKKEYRWWVSILATTRRKHLFVFLLAVLILGGWLGWSSYNSDQTGNQLGRILKSPKSQQQQQQLPVKVNKKKYIFCINPGM